LSTLPRGTVTFLFSDIEGSTRLLEQLGDRYEDVHRDHRKILRDELSAAGGQEIDTQRDAFFFSFTRAKDAVTGAVNGQRALAAHEWPEGADVKVRMGLHTGEPTVGEEGYLGMDVVRAARICSAGHGGQILLSETTRALVGNNVPDEQILGGFETPAGSTKHVAFGLVNLLLVVCAAVVIFLVVRFAL
jgi:class 3 adenylate cyclase